MRAGLFVAMGKPAAPDTLEAVAVAAAVRLAVVLVPALVLAVVAARGLWKTASGVGANVSYWRQSDAGRWEKKA